MEIDAAKNTLEIYSNELINQELEAQAEAVDILLEFLIDNLQCGAEFVRIMIEDTQGNGSRITVGLQVDEYSAQLMLLTGDITDASPKLTHNRIGTGEFRVEFFEQDPCALERNGCVFDRGGHVLQFGRHYSVLVI